MATPKHLGTLIKSKREQKHISIRSLSKEVGLSPSYISMIERGQILGNGAKAQKLFSYLGVRHGPTKEDPSHRKEVSDLVLQANTLLNRFNIPGHNNYYNTYTEVDEALDYPIDIDYYAYRHRYKRQDIAQRIVKAPVGATWRYEPSVYESTEEDTPFEKSFDELKRSINLYYYLYKLDLLASLGRYAVLYLGFNDNKDVSLPVINANNLVYVTPVAEPQANIVQWNTDIKSPRHGKPEVYQISLPVGEGLAPAVKNVHWSRIIHVAENSLENDVYGLPRLEVVYNRLIGLEKLAGGSPEMYWRGARPGYTAQAIDNGIVNDSQLDDLKEQLSNFVNNLQRWLYVEGLNIQSLSPQVVSPKDHVEVQLQLISAACRIPIRILTGSERGELASNQDERAWLSYIDERREEVGEKLILRPLVDRLISADVLKAPKEEYYIEWPPALVLSEKDRAEIGKIHTDSLATYTNSIGASDLMPPEIFLKRELGMSDAEIELATNIIEDELIKEDKERLNEND